MFKRLQYWLVVGVKYLMTGRTRMSEEDVERKLNEIKRIARITLHNLFKGRRETYCPKLGNSTFIDQFGNVFTCCYSRPIAFGNLYQKSMDDIWQQSFRLKLFRWLSRHKGLYCALSCDLLSEEEKSTPPVSAPDESHPTVVRVLHGELCNIACTMCWQNHRDRHVISNDVLKERIDWSRVQDIELQGGEVLAMKQGKEFFVWLTQEMGKKADLITNGMLLNEEWARNLVLGANWVQVSVNAASKQIHEQVNCGSRFEKVIGNIERMAQLKQELHADMKLIYKFTMVPENVHEVADAIAVAAELGCDKIAFGFDAETVPAYLAENPELKTDLRKAIQAEILTGRPLEVETIRLERLGLVDVRRL
jgi:sulfatase maturation enzyme AslB (radical SAM superfamily)